MFWLCTEGVSSFAQNPAPPASAPLANATVADLKGKVRLQLPGKSPSAPTRGQVLPPETTLTTEDGRVLLRLEDGSEVLVLPHTQLVLKQPSTSSWQRLLLTLGRIKAEIQKRTGGSPTFQMGTPGAVISVRGTRFYAGVDKRKVTRVDVEEGLVQLENSKGIGTPVLVKAGFSSRVAEDSAPEPAKPTDEFKKENGNGDGNGKNDHNGDQGHMNPSSNSHGVKSGRRP
jgi:hypothetical protein